MRKGISGGAGMHSSAMGTSYHPQVTGGHGGYQPYYGTPSMSPHSYSSPSPVYTPFRSAAAPPLRKYSLQPPPRRLPLHQSMELGYPDIFPQKSNQEEDQLTENNVRNGFVDKKPVPNEDICAHDMIHDRLIQDNRIMSELGTFMVDVMKRKHESNRITGSSIFKPPSRATLNDQKKEQWMQDLAGGIVPLRKLARNVPHGFKGERLLEALAQRQVPLLRATWYIKVVGMNELQMQRNKAGGSHQPYTLDWTSVFESFLWKQLTELDPLSNSNPSASARPGMKNAGAILNNFTSDEKKERWLSRWLYSIRLAKWQYNEGLLEQRHFLKFNLQQLVLCNFSQTAMLLMLIRQFMGEYDRSRALMRHLIENLIDKLNALLQHPEYSTENWHYSHLDHDLRRMLQAAFIKAPDMFVFPKLWADNFALFQEVLLHNDIGKEDPDYSEISELMASYFDMIHERNRIISQGWGVNGMDDRSSYVEASGMPADEEESLISLLDEIEKTQDLLTTCRQFFGIHTPSAASSSFESRVHLLCEWATTPLRHGDHRCYAVATVLELWRQDVSRGKLARDRQMLLQDALLRFLDVRTSQSDEEYELVSRLYGEFIRLGLFSFQKYMQRLIARGDLDSSKRGEMKTLRHMRYLQSFPLYHAKLYHINQRRIMLYGIEGEDGQQEGNFEMLKKIISEKLPHMFGESASEMTQPAKNDPLEDFQSTLHLESHAAELLKSANRYCQLRITREWLLEAANQFVVKQIRIGEDNWRVMTTPGSSLLNSQQFSTLIHIMEVAKDYCSLFELSLWTLEHTTKALYPAIIRALQRHELVWRSTTPYKQVVFDTLVAHHAKLKAKGAPESCIVKYLLHLVDYYPNTETLKAELSSDLRSASCPQTPVISHRIAQDGFPSMEDLESLASERSTDVAEALASNCHLRFQAVPNALSVVFNSVMNILRSGNPGATHLEKRRTLCNYVVFLRVLRERSNTLLDAELLGWLRAEYGNLLENSSEGSEAKEGVACKELYDVTEKSWLVLFLVLLVAHDVCQFDTLLAWICDEMLGPVVSLTSKPDEKKEDAIGPVMNLCKNITTLLDFLLVNDGGENIPEDMRLNIEEVHALETHRRRFLKFESLEVVLRMLRRLTELEADLPFNAPVYAAIQHFTKELLHTEWFKHACFIHIERIYASLLRDISNNVKEGWNRMANNILLGFFWKVVGEDTTSIDTPSINTDSVSDYMPQFQSIFTRINKWLFGSCRVRLWLLIDRVLMLDTPGAASNAEDDVTMQDASPEQRTEDGHLSLRDECIRGFAQFVFNDLIPQGHLTGPLLAQLVAGFRDELVDTFIREGENVLLGQMGATFPESVLIIDKARHSDKAYTDTYHSVIMRFHHVMAALITKSGAWSEDRKIEFIRNLLTQVKRFEDNIKVYEVMQACNINYDTAQNALQAANGSPDAAIVSVLTERVDQDLQSSAQNITLDDIRCSLLVRLRLLTLVLPLMWQQPVRCEMTQWIATLVNLMSSAVVHGNGTQERVFDFVIDLVSILMDEMPREVRSTFIKELRTTGHGELSLPADFAKRVRRVLPFRDHNIYLSQLQLQNGSTGELQPWEWIEDSPVDMSLSGGDARVNDTPISLTIFGAKRVKRNDGVYQRQFRLGYAEAWHTGDEVVLFSEQEAEGQWLDKLALGSEGKAASREGSAACIPQQADKGDMASFVMDDNLLYGTSNGNAAGGGSDGGVDAKEDRGANASLSSSSGNGVKRKDHEDGGVEEGELFEEGSFHL
ncbi:uncharacterized protein VTP21DRAFT_5759 [Calcarisporiella thermophila]|uniref:uncharacterized protein n=1 Tax=Calcarisporiella thermophila TaxID=911321 RepID=UPI0037420448